MVSFNVSILLNRMQILGKCTLILVETHTSFTESKNSFHFIKLDEIFDQESYCKFRPTEDREFRYLLC